MNICFYSMASLLIKKKLIDIIEWTFTRDVPQCTSLAMRDVDSVLWKYKHIKALENLRIYIGILRRYTFSLYTIAVIISRRQNDFQIMHCNVIFHLINEAKSSKNISLSYECTWQNYRHLIFSFRKATLLVLQRRRHQTIYDSVHENKKLF